MNGKGRQKKRNHSYQSKQKTENFRNERLVHRVKWCREYGIMKTEKHALNVVTLSHREASKDTLHEGNRPATGSD